MISITYLLFLVFFIVCLVYMLLALAASWQVLKVRTGAVVQLNDDRASVKSFLDLLKSAKKSLMIYNDGDQVKGSIYDDDEVLEKVSAKLDPDKGDGESEPGFTIRCWFNRDNPELKFRQRFEGHPRVTIKTLDSAKPRPDDVHYKIIDGGQKAHLSRHDLGSEERMYKIVDCTQVGSIFFLRYFVIKAILGEYLKDFEMRFASAEPASA